MRVMIAASIVAFGLTTPAHAELRYYIDQDVLRKNEAPTLLQRDARRWQQSDWLVASMVRTADGDVGR